MAIRNIPLLVLSMFLATGILLNEKELRAQEFAFKGEVFGKIGSAWPNADWDPLGRGFVFGGGGGYMLGDRWEVVAEVQSQEYSRDLGHGAHFFEGQLLTIGGSFQYHFSKSRLQPYLGMGLNYARYNGARGFRADDSNPETRIEGKQNFWRPHLGFGCKIFLSKHISIDPEARVYLGGLPGHDPAWDLVDAGLARTEFSIGMGYHW